MLNVLLVEDDTDLAATLIDYLALESISCDHASNGVAGLNLVESANYDVVLLDLNLPRMDGVAVCNALRARGDNTPVLMLTARDTLASKAEGFTAGTDDYLVKPFEPEELVMRIRALAQRRSSQVRLLRCGDLSMYTDTRQLYRADVPLHVTPSGWTLLEKLLRTSPAAVSRQQLAQTLWGDEFPDSNALKVHIHHLRKVIDAPFDTPLLQTVAGYGFALIPPERVT